MQEKQLFEYAVIRVVPKVEREEFLNVGVILFCKKLNYLKAMFTLDEERLRHFAPALDISLVRQHLDAFQQISEGLPDSGPIGRLPVAERFRWLTATRSTIVQSSKVHPGLCTTPPEMLNHLYTQLVLPEEGPA